VKIARPGNADLLIGGLIFTKKSTPAFRCRVLRPIPPKVSSKKIFTSSAGVPNTTIFRVGFVHPIALNTIS
jgi:hypothetical protein